MERLTVPVEGSYDGQEMAAALGSLHKFRIALELLEGSNIICQLSSEHTTHPNMIRVCKRQLLEDGPSGFARSGLRKQREQEAQEAEISKQIGRLKMELEWLKESVACFVP